MLEKIVYGVFCIALTATFVFLVICAAAGIYQTVSGGTFMFLYGCRGDIFAVSAVLTVLSAFLSNQLDKFKKKK